MTPEELASRGLRVKPMTPKPCGDWCVLLSAPGFNALVKYSQRDTFWHWHGTGNKSGCEMTEADAIAAVQAYRAARVAGMLEPLP